MSRKVWKRLEEEGDDIKKNPLPTPPEYEPDLLALPSLMVVDMKTFVWGPAAKQRGNNWRGPGAIAVSLHGSQLRPGEENTKANR